MIDRMPVFALSYLADAVAAASRPDPRYPDLVRRITNALRIEGDRAHVEELAEEALAFLWNSNVRSTALGVQGLARRGDGGGKLTTFRIMARDAFKAARKYLGRVEFDVNTPVLDAFPLDTEGLFKESNLHPTQQLRLFARYGIESALLFAADRSHEFIPNTPYFWEELRQAARAEGVIHLDDLLLRRVRLGLLAPNGGQDLLPRIRVIVQPELGWHDALWEKEVSEYAQLWNSSYCLG